ncbi:class I SAM-dependent methyltransferase [Sanguibacter sp. A247]|uniref:class I SAM-dependent methyltransferase n=1 Tax=unclassified Sanguibacter TaxID=2645534 RepID=UPI003FD7F89B
MMRSPRPSPAEFWEELYTEEGRRWSGRVNASTADVVRGLAPGRSLDLGCGEGGDVVWCARNGWEATGVDISPTAIARGEAAAAADGLGERTHFVVADLATWAPATAFDLVTASFFQSPVELSRGEILRRVAASIAPGGHLVVVSHAAAPPWMTAKHEGHGTFPTPESEVAEIALDPATWTVIVAEVRRRAAVGPDGAEAELDDSVVVLRRG